MLALIACLAFQTPAFTRDSYGVPIIRVNSKSQAFYAFGYSVAEDRLWQMENSRRAARGRLAEVFGAKFAAADQQVLSQSYTAEELKAMVTALPAEYVQYFESYVSGVNAYIESATSNRTLPKGYADNGFSPAPWSIEDSAAIMVQLMRKFGNGGSGELRNLTLLEYLKTQPKLKGKELDCFDDLAWQNDHAALTTVSKADDPVKNPPEFPNPTRAITQAQIATLPKLGLFELIPALTTAKLDESTRVNELLSVPFKTGSYCIVVGAKRSATGKPILLSGPQMGFTEPSIVHEAALHAPGLDVAGMDVPGIPAILVGATPNMAWGITTGVADVEDIVAVKTDGPDHYLIDGVRKEFEKVKFDVPVRADERTKVPPAVLTQLRTELGTVVFKPRSAPFVFVKRRAYAGKEIESGIGVFKLYTSRSMRDVDEALSHAAMNINLFSALKTGDFGWRYCGKMPIRPLNIDPRLPVVASKATDWQGFIPFEKMPHVWNPSAGLIFNWNNKPADWWVNMDTPVWGRAFRNQILAEELTKPKLTVADVEKAPWALARKTESWPYLKSLVPSGTELDGFDGWLLEGSVQGLLYEKFVAQLKKELFIGTTGNFSDPNNFNQVIQLSLLVKALQGKTFVNYLAGRSAADVIRSAIDKVKATVDRNAGFAAWSIPIAGQAPIPYRDRGTYIQVIELGEKVRGRNVLPPGVSESGGHQQDQVPLSRAWIYKAMHIAP